MTYTPPALPQFKEHWPGRKYLSVSSLVSWARCPRKFFYETVGVKSPLPAPALLFGEAIHAALPLGIMEGMKPALEAFDKIWDRDLEDGRNHSRNQAILMIGDFVRTHGGPNSLFSLLPPPASPGVKMNERVSDWEVPFAIDIGVSVPLVGRIDGLCRHRDTGEVWALEYKTTSQMTGWLQSGFQSNLQLIAYTLVMRTLGAPVKGVIVDLLLKKKGKAQTVPQPYYISDQQINAFLQWVPWAWHEILKMEKNQFFPQDRSGCHPYGQFAVGGFQCSFLDLCNAPEWTDLMSSFEVKPRKVFELLQAETPETPPKGSTP